MRLDPIQTRVAASTVCLVSVPVTHDYGRRDQPAGRTNRQLRLSVQGSRRGQLASDLEITLRHSYGGN